MAAPDEVERRDNWWHVILAAPPSTLAVQLVGELGVLLFLPFWFLYPIAFWLDGKYLRAVDETAAPGSRFSLAAGLLGFLSLGLLTWVISPYYLYKRHAWIGVP